MVTTSCVLYDENQVFRDAFTLSLSPEDSVHQVKKQIKQTLAPDLDYVSAAKISLWKLTAPLNLNEGKTEFPRWLEFPHQDSKDAQEGQGGLQLLSPLRALSQYWSDVNSLSREYLHLVARLPDTLPPPNPLKRKHEDELMNCLLEETAPLYKLFKALWGRETDDFIKVTKSEVVPNINGTSPGTTSSSITYDLSKAVDESLFPLCNHFLVREEYVEFFEYATSRGGSKNFLLLGQPGIGKTIYLTYHLVKRLLAGRPTIVAFSQVDRFLFHESGVYVVESDSLRTLWRIKPELNRGRPLVLVDFNVNQMQSNLAAFSNNPILVASSPNRHRYKGWAKETNAEPFVMKTWGWDEIFHARSFVSAEYAKGLRERFLKYGGCARLLFQKAPAIIESDISIAIQNCRDIERIVGIQDTIPEDGTSALIRVEPAVEPDGSINRMNMFCEVISQHVFEQLVKAQPVIANSFRKNSDFFQG